MKSTTYRVKYALALAAFVTAALSLAVGTAAAQGRTGLSEQERRGKQIYLKGTDDARDEITAVLGGGDIEVPASTLSCVNCHGFRGEGTREGGIQAPPVDWLTLTSRHASALTGRERGPYTDASLARSIAGGVNSNGLPLHPAMPRYRMTGGQMSDLVAYLKKVGTGADADPGVTDEAIRVGAALPLSGPLAQVGEDIRAALAASFDAVNSQGGVYGRRFELVVEDSRGEPARTVEATRGLIERGGVFALVGSFEPGDSRAVNELIMRGEIPLVGPVTLSPRLSVPPNPYVFYLLPTFGDQARSLVDFVKAESKGATARLGVVYADTDFDRDALAGVKSQAEIYSMEVVAEESYKAGQFSAADAVRALASKKADHVFFFGDADSIKAFAEEMERAKMNAPLLSSVAMIGRGAFALPPGVAARTRLAYPALLPGQSDFGEFLSVMQKGGVGLRSPAFQSVAFAATKVFYEAVKSSGKRLDRAALIKALEQTQDLKTGVVPPVTFGPNRRVGSTGSQIVGINLDAKQFVPLQGV